MQLAAGWPRQRQEGRLIELMVIGAAGWAGVFGVAAARLAARRERFAPAWFGFGAILGPIALLLLRFAPPGHCPWCGTPTRGWLRTCRWCRADVSADLTVPSKAATMSIAAEARATTVERQVPTPERTNPPAVERTDSAPGQGQGTAPSASRTSPRHRAPGIRPVADDRRSTPERPSPVLRPAVASPPAAMADIAPVNRLTPAPGPIAAVAPHEPETRIVATAVYVAGTTRLEPGNRYSIAIHGPRLRILGPTDTDPARIALDRPIDAIRAGAVEGRLILSEPGARSGPILAFMSVAGPSPGDLATLIARAADAAANR